MNNNMRGVSICKGVLFLLIVVALQAPNTSGHKIICIEEKGDAGKDG